MHLFWCSMFQVFHKRMPPEAIDLASRLLQYSPSLRCTAVSRMNYDTSLHFSPLNKRKTYTGKSLLILTFLLWYYIYIPYGMFFNLVNSIGLIFTGGFYYFSWKHVHILSLMSFANQMPGYLMAVHCPHFSTSNRRYIS